MKRFGLILSLLLTGTLLFVLLPISVRADGDEPSGGDEPEIVTPVVMEAPETITEKDDIGYTTIKEYDYPPEDTEGETAPVTLQGLLDKAINEDDSVLVQINIADGTYNIDCPLVIYSNTFLNLSDDAKLVRATDSGLLLYAQPDSGDMATIGGYDLAKNIFIEGGSLIGNAAASQNYNGPVRFNHCNNIIIRNTSFSDSIGHMLNLSGCKNVLVDSCTFSGFVKYGGTSEDFYMGPFSEDKVISRHRSIEAIHLDFMNAEGEDDLYLLDGTGPSNIVISSCTFEGVVRGVGTHHLSSDIKGTDITIKDNTFRSVKTACVSLYSYSNVTVSGNTCSDSGFFLITEDVSDLVISSNRISGMITEDDPINQVVNPLYLIDATNVTVEKNEISGCDKDDPSRAINANILVQKVDTITFTENKSEKSTDNAVLVKESKNVTFNNISSEKKNDFTITSGENPISVYDSDAVIGFEEINGSFYCSNSSIKLYSNTINGRVNFSASPSFVAENNVITTKKVQAININNPAGPVTFKNNTISTSECENAAYIKSKGQKIILSGNSFSSNVSKNYIYIEDSDSVTIESNKMDIKGASAEQGISVNNSTVTIKDNSVSGCTKYGLYCKGGAKITATDNTFTGCAVNLTSATVTFTGNKVDASSQNTAIILKDITNSKIDNNDLKYGREGIYLNNCKDSSILNNTYSGEYKTWYYAESNCSNNKYPPKPSSPDVTGTPASPTPPEPTTPPVDDDSASFGGFVERLYNVALGRDSEADGKNFWVANVSAGNLTGADCAKSFLLSPEFLSKDMSDEQFIGILYQTFFARNYKDDPEGTAFWLNSLKVAGKDTVVDGFINSTEWCNICASFGVRSGATRAKATIPSSNAKAFAERLYTCCLGREAEQEGLMFWSLALTNQETSGSDAARLFFESGEFTGFGLDDRDYIKRLYTTFMGREADDGGLTFWLNSMANGATRNDIFNSFVASPEFTEICKSYGIRK